MVLRAAGIARVAVQVQQRARLNIRPVTHVGLECNGGRADGNTAPQQTGKTDHGRSLHPGRLLPFEPQTVVPGQIVA
jgi:hypothetical protein